MIKLFACGDIVNSQAKADFCDEELKDIIRNCDVAICNLEAPIAAAGSKPLVKAGPHLKQPEAAIGFLKEAGFDLACLANNHVCDYGGSSLITTIEQLKSCGIQPIGAGRNFDEAYEPLSLTVNGLKIGILAGAENGFGCLDEKERSGGYAWIFHDRIEENIRSLKQSSDFVIFLAHAGAEEVDMPLKEWRVRYRKLCELGCDVVIGHHPHVPQGYEKHGKSLIFYSLGNFFFDTDLVEESADDSFSLILKLEKNREAAFEIIYHKKVGGQVVKSTKSEATFDLEELNAKLGEGYEEYQQKTCLRLFSKYHYRYYREALGGLPPDASLTQTLKFFLKKFVLRRPLRDNKVLLLHNLKIDSHRFVVQRALSLICE
jgi:poly-gamma-glutamate synthesis protein (capsule biosynthesis protein)